MSVGEVREALLLTLKIFLFSMCHIIIVHKSDFDHKISRNFHILVAHVGQKYIQINKKIQTIKQCTDEYLFKVKNRPWALFLCLYS